MLNPSDIDKDGDVRESDTYVIFRYMGADLAVIDIELCKLKYIPVARAVVGVALARWIR